MNKSSQRPINQAQQVGQRIMQGKSAWAYDQQKKKERAKREAINQNCYQQIKKEKANRETIYQNYVLNGVCLDCSGSGKQWLFFKCHKCNGTGRVDYCQACEGKGKGWIFTCKYCHGSGRI